MRRFAHAIVILAAAGSIGLHWLALQSAAWTGMLIRNAQSESFLQAVERTFSGDEPCRICVFIEKEKEKESGPTSNSIAPDRKIDFSLDFERFMAPPAIEGLCSLVLPEPEISGRPSSPPSPPPRRA